MGAELSLLAPTAATVAVSAYVDFLNNVQYSKAVGSARFLKTVKALDTDGNVIVKVLIKPIGGLDLEEWVNRLEDQRLTLSDVPNALSYEKIIDSSRAGYLIRPFIKSNLYDRISIRPFLEKIEKRWLVYQLLVTVAQCHERDVFHGDIKTENVLVTSWNWVLLADFAPFKPIFMPEDNPSEFSFYFDTSQRHICYLAPERFLAPGEAISGRATLTKEMDIFSVGCVIAELFLEGSPIFTLSQLFKYKRGEYRPNLEAIDDVTIREMVQSMVSLEPSSRLSAAEYLEKYRNSAFPDHFYSFLHTFMTSLAGPGSNKPQSPYQKFEQCDMRIRTVYDNFDKILHFLGFANRKASDLDTETGNVSGTLPHPSNLLQEEAIPVRLDLPGLRRHTPLPTRLGFNGDSSALLILGIVLHSVRNTTHSSYRIQACDLIIALAERLHDEGKLDRCLPYLIYLLDDPCEDVQAAALRSITQLLSMVNAITPVNALIFPEYIIPRLHAFWPRASGAYTRAVFAGVLPYLAHNATRFHEMANLLKLHVEASSAIDPETEGGYVNTESVFDTPKRSLESDFEKLAVNVLTDSDPNVRLSLLRNILPLCGFFGKEKTNDIILSHLITYLNDKYAPLRVAFVESIVGISIFVGVTSLEQYILPLLVQTLADSDEIVVINVVRAFTELAKLGLIRKPYLWDAVKLIAELLLHPNEWIRHSTLCFIISVADNLTLADLYCMLYPLIRPFFEYELTDFTWETLYCCTHKPLSRSVYNMAKVWSLKANKTLFWQQVRGGRKDSFGFAGVTFLTKKTAGNTSRTHQNRKDFESGVISNGDVPISQEDKGWVDRLKASGLAETEIWKVATLRGYVFRLARSNNHSNTTDAGPMDQEVQKLSLMPRNVFFDVSHKSELVFTDSETPTVRPEAPKTSPSNGLSSDNSKQVSTVETETEAGKRLKSLVLGNMKKAAPSLHANQENAFAELDTVSTTSHSAHIVADEKVMLQKITTKVHHSYNGQNPYILGFLGSITFQPSLDDYSEFGPTLSNLPSTGRTFNVTNNAKAKTDQPHGWSPKGVLVAHIVEHKSSINCVAVSPSNNYFVTGDEDGEIKIWDSLKLESNVTGSSSLSVSLSSAVKALSFIDNRDCFAVALKDGSVKIFRVGFEKNLNFSRYNRLSLVREFQFGDGEYACSICFSITMDKPYLILLTPLSKVVILDIRTMDPVVTLQNKLSHGVARSFCIDHKRSWMLIGTNSGVLDLWDLRFELHLKSVRMKGGFPIHEIKACPPEFEIGLKRNRFAFVIGGTGESDVTLWDVSKMQCRKAYCSSGVNLSLEDYTAIDVNNDETEFELESNFDMLTLQDRKEDKSGTAIALVESSWRQQNHLQKSFYIVNSTHDKRLLFWNLSTPEESAVVSGTAKSATIFSSTQITPNFTIVSERYSSEEPPSSSSLQKLKTMKTRSTLLNQDQLNSMKNHHDAITSIATIVKPYEMVISADRSGVINVYK
ncbi:unnamed protein product [Kuraishia capsulata CBS 1993]|uniref:non-specific serine/threonine protein kinase n=1 Tax=Kuraishia capsulata CBS 1993 TaxID=1382522 RepID=W6MUL8_9ASCO|nr:uncharacterized protein KUCA_T00005375001 [Kuraishia capsulata CBS 1993]CDK29387.1 unnamed protein product [Kuraishia capsulata CBS 1993]